MEKLATLHYINLAFIPHDCNEAPKQNPPLALKQKYPAVSPPKRKIPRTVTVMTV